MKCLILDCGNEATRWYRVDDRGGPFMTASCTTCEKKAIQSVVGLDGRSVVTEVGQDEFVVAEVMEVGIDQASVELGNGRLLYIGFDPE